MASELGGLPKGIPALLLLLALLGVLVVAAAATGVSVKWPSTLVCPPGGVRGLRGGGDTDTDTDTVSVARFYALGCSVVAAPFWAWAVANTAEHGSLDGGVVTFLIVIIGAATCLWTSAAPWAVQAVAVGSGLVSANYGIPAAVLAFGRPGVPWTWPFYFGVAATAWLWACWAGVTLRLRRRQETGPRYQRIGSPVAAEADGDGGTKSDSS